MRAIIYTNSYASLQQIFTVADGFRSIHTLLEVADLDEMQIKQDFFQFILCCFL